MPESEDVKKEELTQERKHTFSETNELGHERNPVAKAQKEAASQETAGLWGQPTEH